jgi:LuxR family maltose regulon positive regulatory protein
LLIAQAWQQQLDQLDAPVADHLATAEALLDTPNAYAEVESVPALRGKIAALRSGSCYWQGKRKESQMFAREAVALLPADHPLTPYALSYLIRAQSPAQEAEDVFHQLKRTIRSQQIVTPTNLSPLLLAQVHLSLYAAKLDQLADAANSLLNYGTRLGLPLTRAWGHYFLGRVSYERDDLDTAAEHFSVVTSNRGPVPLNAQVNSLLGLSLIYRARGATSASKEIFSTLEALENVPPEDIAAFRAWQAIAEDEEDTAIAWVETSPVPDVVCYPFLQLNPLLTRIRVLIAQGSRESLLEAIRLLLTALRAAQSTGNRLCIVNVLALRALVLRAQGSEETALDVLERAVNMARQGGLVRSFVDLGLPMANLLYHLVDRQEGADSYAEQLLAAFERRTTVHPLTVQANESLVEPLTERELEVLTMLARRLSNIEIAQRLDISPLTVKKHTINIYQKFNVQNRRDAVAVAGKLGLIVD